MTTTRSAVTSFARLVLATARAQLQRSRNSIEDFMPILTLPLLTLVSMAILAHSGRDDLAGYALVASILMTVGQMVTDLRDQMGKVTAPVLLLVAADFTKDDAARERVRASYEAQVAQVRTHTVTLVPDARHFIMLGAPDALWSAMDAFLAAPSALDNESR